MLTCERESHSGLDTEHVSCGNESNTSNVVVVTENANYEPDAFVDLTKNFGSSDRQLHQPETPSRSYTIVKSHNAIDVQTNKQEKTQREDKFTCANEFTSKDTSRCNNASIPNKSYNKNFVEATAFGIQLRQYQSKQKEKYISHSNQINPVTPFWGGLITLPPDRLQPGDVVIPQAKSPNLEMRNHLRFVRRMMSTTW